MATKFVTVSIDIMHDVNLNQSQKFILAEIEQLSQLDKGCIASNQHFSDLIGITKENVSRNINELQAKGYINIEIVPGTRNHTRIVTLTTLVRPPYQSSKTPLLKQQETKENKTTNKTTNKTVIADLNCYKEIIDHLNQVTESNYKATGSKTKSLISARLNEGFTVDDFKQVHINKYAEWHNDSKMAKFLRPETLYGTKFEGYLNQKISDYEKMRMIQKHTGASMNDIIEDITGSSTDDRIQEAKNNWHIA